MDLAIVAVVRLKKTRMMMVTEREDEEDRLARESKAIIRDNIRAFTEPGLHSASRKPQRGQHSVHLQA